MVSLLSGQHAVEGCGVLALRRQQLRGITFMAARQDLPGLHDRISAAELTTTQCIITARCACVRLLREAP